MDLEKLEMFLDEFDKIDIMENHDFTEREAGRYEGDGLDNIYDKIEYVKNKQYLLWDYACQLSLFLLDEYSFNEYPDALSILRDKPASLNEEQMAEITTHIKIMGKIINVSQINYNYSKLLFEEIESKKAALKSIREDLEAILLRSYDMSNYLLVMMNEEYPRVNTQTKRKNKR